MKQPIIPIHRASEEVIEALLAVGLLVITDDGLTTGEEDYED